MVLAAAAAAQSDVVREVVVRGNVRVGTEAILSVMTLKPGQPFLESSREQDEQSINAMGYFSAATVTAQPVEEGAYRIVVDVKEYGEIKEIRFAGNTAATSEELLKAIPFKPGDVFKLNLVPVASRAIQSLYERKGSFAVVAEFGPLTDSPGTLSIIIQESKVGVVTVNGARDTKDYVFRRLIRTRSGQVFNAERWRADIVRLQNTQWFRPGSIDGLADTQREPGLVDLTALVQEDRTGNFQIGLQVDPQNAIAGVIKLQEINFRGTGQSIGIDLLQAARIGGPSISLDYANPFLDEKGTGLRASLYSRIVYRFANTFGQTTFAGGNDYFERRTGGAGGITRLFLDRPNNVVQGGLSARYEGVRTNVPVGVTSALFTDPAGSAIRQDGQVGVLTFGLTRDRRDLALDASRGDFLAFNLEPGFSNIQRVSGPLDVSDILGRSTFIRTSFDYRSYFTNGKRRTIRDIDGARRVLAFRARGGTIIGRVPFFEQFFAGGAQSVRGYNEDQFWGKNQLITTAELRLPVQRAFNVIAFVDYGGAWGGYPGFNNLIQSNSFKLHLGYGFGVSVRTPLGPIRLDLGFDENGRSRTHFLIGTSF